MLYALARGVWDMLPGNLKIKSYKIESGGNFSPTTMVIAKNTHIVFYACSSDLDHDFS